VYLKKTPRFGMVPMEHKLTILPLRADHTGRSDNVTDLCTTGACQLNSGCLEYIYSRKILGYGHLFSNHFLYTFTGLPAVRQSIVSRYRHYNIINKKVINIIPQRKLVQSFELHVHFI
jgi:hypothetical protein